MSDPDERPAAAPTSTIEFAGRDGNRLVATAAGDPSDPPVLLVHGGGQTRHSWHTTTARLGAAGWYAVSMDQRGHGDSAWAADRDYSLEAFRDDLLAVAVTLGRPVMIGASLGGTASLAALGATATDPCGRALVLVDIAPHVEPAGVDRIRAFMTARVNEGFASLDEVADAVHAYNPHRPRPKDLDGLRKNVRLGADGRWYWHWDPAFMTRRSDEDVTVDEPRVRLVDRWVLVAAARSLTVPALLVRGRQSDLLSEEGARQFLDLVTHARFADVGGAGHMVAGDRNDAFNDAVTGFLAEL
jgi:pimeloyl-ACP methyl ester carboxylesterase